MELGACFATLKWALYCLYSLAPCFFLCAQLGRTESGVGGAIGLYEVISCLLIGSL